MSSSELPKDLTKPDRVEGMLPVGGSDRPREASSAFQAMMKGPVESGPPATTSPFELAKANASVISSGPTIATVQSQVVHAQSSLGDVASLLSTPQLKLKPSTKYLLGSKLSDASQQLRTVNAKVGGNLGGEQEEQPLAAGTSKGMGPIQKFLGYVSSGQASLAAARQKIQDLSEHADTLNPAELLLVQIKLNKAQQLIDYSSVLLSKAIDDMKMLFSVQL